MHYLIFIPHEIGKGLCSPQQALERVGLGDFIPNHEGRDSRGPGEVPQGNLIAWKRPGKNDRCHFNANEQTWIPSFPNGPDGEGKGRYWVGFWNDSPIVPDDLLLPQATWGTTFTLGDDNPWVVPTLRDFGRDVIRNADTGEWETTVQARYHQAHFGALGWNDRLVKEDNPMVPLAEIAPYVEGVLKLNYRLLPEVTDHLRLLNSKNLAPLLRAIIGAAIFNEVQK